MEQKCDAAKACFHFCPVLGEFRTEEEFDVLITIIRETIQSETGEAAKFYCLRPSIELGDGSFDLTVYRDEYVKKNPGEFGLKRKQARKLVGPLPDEFASLMFHLSRELSLLCKIKKETTYNLFSISEDGTEYVAAETGIVLEPDDYDDEDGSGMSGAFDEFGDFGPIERYSIDDDDGDNDEDF